MLVNMFLKQNEEYVVALMMLYFVSTLTVNATEPSSSTTEYTSPRLLIWTYGTHTRTQTHITYSIAHSHDLKQMCKVRFISPEASHHFHLSTKATKWRSHSAAQTRAARSDSNEHQCIRQVIGIRLKSLTITGDKVHGHRISIVL